MKTFIEILLAVVALLALLRLVIHVPQITLAARFQRHRGVRRNWRKIQVTHIRWYDRLPWRQPRVHFANIAEGVHPAGNKTYLSDAAIATRFFLLKQGSDADHIAASAANTDIPLGVCTDEPSAAEELCNVAILGAAAGTIKMVAAAAIAAGAYVQSNGDGKIITLKATTGTWYIIGRAVTAAAADGDVIEVAHCVPVQRVVP